MISVVPWSFDFNRNTAANFLITVSPALKGGVCTHWYPRLESIRTLKSVIIGLASLEAMAAVVFADLDILHFSSII